MSKRLNVDWYFDAFEGKTLEEAEGIAIESLKNCQRPMQAKIAFNALEQKYDNYKAKDLSDEIVLADKIRSEFEMGATKAFLKKQYKVTIKRIDEMLKDVSKKKAFETEIPVVEEVDVATEDFKKMLEKKPIAKKK